MNSNVRFFKLCIFKLLSACGKINLVMMILILLGWKVECIGDDIVWMWFDEEG